MNGLKMDVIDFISYFLFVIFSIYHLSFIIFLIYHLSYFPFIIFLIYYNYIITLFFFILIKTNFYWNTLLEIIFLIDYNYIITYFCYWLYYLKKGRKNRTNNGNRLSKDNSICMKGSKREGVCIEYIVLG